MSKKPKEGRSTKNILLEKILCNIKEKDERLYRFLVNGFVKKFREKKPF